MKNHLSVALVTRGRVASGLLPSDGVLGRHVAGVAVALALLAGCGASPDAAPSQGSADAGSPGEVAPDARGVAPSEDVPAVGQDVPAVDPFTDPESAVPASGSGVITLSGGSETGALDGTPDVARFNNPTNIALGPDGNLYVADYDNGVIRVVRPSGMTLTLTRQEGFAHPFGLAFAPDGTLYAQTDSDDGGRRDYESGTVWRVDRRSGAATPLVRSIGRPRGLVVVPDGRLVMVDNEHHVIRVLDPATLQITDLAGTRDAPGYADGTGAAARFDHPYDVVLTRDNVLLVADQYNNRLRAITLDGVVSTFAGAGAPGSSDGPAAFATFNRPQALAIDTAGNVFVTELAGFVVRRIAADGAVTTVAGSGRGGFANGEPMRAEFFGLEGLDVSRSGNTLFIADGNRGGTENSHRVRRVQLFGPKG